MKRRDFLALSVAGTGAFTLGIDALAPRRAEALVFLIFLKSVAGPSLLSMTLGGLALLGLGGSRGRSQAWYDKRVEAQFAQREFLRRSFRDVQVAEANAAQYNYVLSAYREEALGNSVGLVFPRVRNGQASQIAISGPGSIAMSVAARYLHEHDNLTPEQIQAAILPRMRGGIELNGWRSWNQSGEIIYPTTFSDTGIRIRYRAVKPHLGGFGTIDVTANAHRTVKIPTIKVKFS